MELRVLRVSRSFIYMKVDLGMGKEWMMTTVYANPNPSLRRYLWDQLDELAVDAPWMLVSDFNCVLADEERSSKTGVSSCFQNWVRRAGLIDLGYVGSQYTWKHGTSSETRRATRLDRAISCDEWRRLFPSATIRHLTHAHSDHCPVLVELLRRESIELGERPFKFQAAWMLHADFHNMMRREWCWQGSLMCTLKCLIEKLRAWNRDTFGNIFWRKERLRNRLEGVAKALDEKNSVWILKLELKLKREWADVLL